MSSSSLNHGKGCFSRVTKDLPVTVLYSTMHLRVTDDDQLTRCPAGPSPRTQRRQLHSCVFCHPANTASRNQRCRVSLRRRGYPFSPDCAAPRVCYRNHANSAPAARCGGYVPPWCAFHASTRFQHSSGTSARSVLNISINGLIHGQEAPSSTEVFPATVFQYLRPAEARRAAHRTR